MARAVADPAGAWQPAAQVPSPNSADWLSASARRELEGVAGGRSVRLAQAVRLFERGEQEAAFAVMQVLLSEYPGWVEGYLTMAQLLSQSSEPRAFEPFLVNAVRGRVGDIGLATACLRQLSEAGCHASVLSLVPDVRAWAGDHLFFTLIEAIASSECGDVASASKMFALANQQGGLLSLPHVRHLLRTGDVEQAAAVAESFTRAFPDNQGGWGLLATSWRAAGDPRHAWLVEQPGLVRTIDVDLSDEEIVALAQCLRGLHGGRAHPLDQSLRGGTQTAGRLLRRDEPEIRRARQALTAAVRSHINMLPPFDARHPLLGKDRSRFHFTDSWSVRLIDGGYHLAHIHPQGTLSSALYVALPAPLAGHDMAGWLTVGGPPPGLCPDMEPLLTIEPRVGRLALFPSYLWHGTRPFPQGERMTIAFDTVLGD